MSKGTRMATVRLSPAYREMLAKLQVRWNTTDLSDTIRQAIRFGYDASWWRCMVCGIGLGPLLAEGISDGLCERCAKSEIAKVEEWEGEHARNASQTSGEAEGG